MPIKSTQNLKNTVDVPQKAESKISISIPSQDDPSELQMRMD